MFKKLMRGLGFVHKGDILREATELYIENAECKGQGEKEFYYACGNANALNGLCHRLHIDITDSVKREHQKRARKQEGET